MVPVEMVGWLGAVQGRAVVGSNMFLIDLNHVGPKTPQYGKE